jgi:uncharacterized protein DUF3854
MSRTLFAEHQTMLAESAILAAVRDERGYWSASWAPDRLADRQELRRAGIPNSALPRDGGTALVLPCFDVHGEQSALHVRPDYAVPDRRNPERSRKYIAPMKAPPMLDVPPRCQPQLRDADTPLWITEGAKKADALASHGQCAVSLSGVWNWRHKANVLADWDEITLRGRTVYLAFDSDAVRNRGVLAALTRLHRVLSARHAKPRIALPPMEVAA